MLCFEDAASAMAKKALEFVGKRRTIIAIAFFEGGCCQVRAWVLNPDFHWKFTPGALDSPLLMEMTKLAVDSLAKKQEGFPLPEGFFILNEHTAVGLRVDSKSNSLRAKCLSKMKE